MEKIIATLESICGIRPELTIRGDKSFTFSFETVEITASEKLAKFFSGYKCNIAHDEECGSFVYVDA